MRRQLMCAFGVALLAAGTGLAPNHLYAGQPDATDAVLARCAKLYDPSGRRCEEKLACHVVIIKDGSDYAITGDASDPKLLCQHGGTCIPISSVKFTHPCKRICTNPDKLCMWVKTK